MAKMPVLVMFTYRYSEKLRFFILKTLFKLNLLYCILRENLKEKQNLFQNIIPVSYTHLDVYKRQTWTVMLSKLIGIYISLDRNY